HGVKSSSSSILALVASKYFQPGLERADYVRKLFARIASRYDLINDLQSFGLHRLWKRRLVRLAAIQPGETALDLCCGTGDVAMELARSARGQSVRKTGPAVSAARIMGADFSPDMLNTARTRADAAGLHEIEWIEADALAMPWPGGTFELVTI